MSSNLNTPSASPTGEPQMDNAALTVPPIQLTPVTDLRCYACTRRPRFSNTSHLLTHLGSKAHQRQLFELGLRSRMLNCQDSTDRLKAYHKWYQEQNLDYHLLERYINKRNGWSREKARPQVDDAMSDPIKVEQPDENAPHGNQQERQLALQLLATVPNVNTVVKAVTPNGAVEKNRSEKRSAAESKRTTAGNKRTTVRPVEPTKLIWPEVPKRGNRRGSSTRANDSPILSVQRPAIPTFRADTEIRNGPQPEVTISNRNSRLRGKLWPGMGVFDSALQIDGKRVLPKKPAQGHPMPIDDSKENITKVEEEEGDGKYRFIQVSGRSIALAIAQSDGLDSDVDADGEPDEDYPVTYAAKPEYTAEFPQAAQGAQFTYSPLYSPFAPMDQAQFRLDAPNGMHPLFQHEAEFSYTQSLQRNPLAEIDEHRGVEQNVDEEDYCHNWRPSNKENLTPPRLADEDLHIHVPRRMGMPTLNQPYLGFSG